MKVKLPDETTLDLSDGSTGADAARSIGEGLARDALAIRVNGEIQDLSRTLADGQSIEVITTKSSEALGIIRHDAAHVMAAAVLDIWPETKVSIGPAIEDGFYYDFDFPEGVSVSEDDFAGIEQKMAEHIKAGEVFERFELPVAEAESRFADDSQDYKLELIRDLVSDEGVESVTLYRNGPFTDLCRGPHSPSIKSIKSFKLLSVAGAYWRGDERNKMLTRIYGTAFFSKKGLDQYLHRIEQARERDHRRLGQKLELFRTMKEAPGMPFFLPNGMRVLGEIEARIEAQLDKRGYQQIRTPHLLDEELWHRSGHYENYRENMYFTGSEDHKLAIRPMNCPGACLVYKSTRRSYRDLPLRLAEFGLVTRNEREGVLHGLMRVRAFVQDDAHVFCTPEQVVGEVKDIVEAIDELYALFGFDDLRIELSTRPEKSIGSDEDWQRAEQALSNALAELGRDFKINKGDGAFYGPKIDFHITDALGRSWQCGTCQLDFSMPERFELSYIGSDNAEHRPVMVHRALVGSMERFLGILIEHYGGEFPPWLAPVQALVMPIADRHHRYATDVKAELIASGVRAELDLKQETIGKRIREAELRKIPYMLVIGDKEESSATVAVRRHRKGDIGAESIAEFTERLSKERPI